MPVLTDKVTPEQREWLERYERETGFEPMYQEELNGDPIKFYEVARLNIDWFESWASDSFLRASSNIPGSDEALDAELDEMRERQRRGRGNR